MAGARPEIYILASFLVAIGDASPPPGDAIEGFSVPEQPAGNAQQRRDYHFVVLVWVLDSRLYKKPPQKGG